MKHSKRISIAIVAVGALVTSGILLSTTAPVDGPSHVLLTAGLYAWALLPFAVLTAMSLYVHRRDASLASRVAILVASASVVASSVLVYWASVFDAPSSTAGLVFLFVPVYALVGTAVLYWAAWLVVRSLVPEPRG